MPTGTTVPTADRLHPRCRSARRRHGCRQVLQACRQGTVETVDGQTIPIEFESVCIHSDTRGAYELMRTSRDGLDDAGIDVRSFAVA